MSDLFENEIYRARVDGRYVIVDLKTPCATTGTSFVNGGSRFDLKHLVNHQCVEGSGHRVQGEKIHRLGQEAYHDWVCGELGLLPEATAILSTAANMKNCAVKSGHFRELSVTALVTAGVQGNAGRAGDPASWHEEDMEWEKLHAHAGTINIILLINWPLSRGALTRALVTATEAKTAALLELAVPGKYSPDLATGTGTDQILAAAPLDDSKQEKHWTGKHSKLGELIGSCVKEATREALRWQNGLESSYTRSLPHALGRYGFNKETLMGYMRDIAGEEGTRLFEKNEKALLYEAGVSACCFALASVLDRARHEAFPPASVRDILSAQAALLASQLSGKPQNYAMYLSEVQWGELPDLSALYRALALGWRDKWKA